MFVAVAIYKIKPEHIKTFQRRMLLHAATCLREEPGCLAFEVNRSQDDPAVFLMHELYRDAEDFVAHGRTPHIKTFVADRDGQGWLAERAVYKLDRIGPDGAASE